MGKKIKRSASQNKIIRKGGQDFFEGTGEAVPFRQDGGGVGGDRSMGTPGWGSSNSGADPNPGSGIPVKVHPDSRTSNTPSTVGAGGGSTTLASSNVFDEDFSKPSNAKFKKITAKDKKRHTIRGIAKKRYHQVEGISPSEKGYGTEYASISEYMDTRGTFDKTQSKTKDNISGIVKFADPNDKPIDDWNKWLQTQPKSYLSGIFAKYPKDKMKVIETIQSDHKSYVKNYQPKTKDLKFGIDHPGLVAQAHYESKGAPLREGRWSKDLTTFTPGRTALKSIRIPGKKPGTFAYDFQKVKTV